MGAHFQSTVCLAGLDTACLSPAQASLDTAEACRAHQAWAEQCLRLLAGQGTPARAVAHDAHPDFPATQMAQTLACAHGMATLAVQHHHAHLAAAWAEHAALEGPPRLLGLAMDGFGLGSDQQAWGGELLHLDGPHAHRLGHVSPLAMPGGDAVTREPWRLAVAALHHMGRRSQALRHAESHAPPGMAEPLLQLLRHPRHSPPTTSLGRWFEAAASLLGLCHTPSHPAQAAQALEAAALRHGTHAPLAQGWHILAPAGALQTLDLSPLLAHLADAPDPQAGAACFHATVIEALAEWLTSMAHAMNIPTVALAGGCLHNRLLREGLVQRLTAAGLRCLIPVRLPPGDMAIAYGQVVVARLVLAYH